MSVSQGTELCVSKQLTGHGTIPVLLSGFPHKSITTFHPSGVGLQALSQTFPLLRSYNYADRSTPIQTFFNPTQASRESHPLDLRLAFGYVGHFPKIKFSNCGMVFQNTAAYHIVGKAYAIIYSSLFSRKPLCIPVPQKEVALQSAQMRIVRNRHSQRPMECICLLIETERNEII